jgi:hypothetical protein
MGLSKEAQFQERDLEIALLFADHHEEFDDTFLQSLKSFFDNKGYLTDKQYSSLRNVMDAWNMEEATECL